MNSDFEVAKRMEHESRPGGVATPGQKRTRREEVLAAKQARLARVAPPRILGVKI